VAHEVGEDQTARSYLHEALASAIEIQAWPLVLDILVSMTLASSKDVPRALTWRMLSLACDHPATENRTREEARTLIAQP
jgi:hypothetical protein